MKDTDREICGKCGREIALGQTVCGWCGWSAKRLAPAEDANTYMPQVVPMPPAEDAGETEPIMQMCKFDHPSDCTAPNCSCPVQFQPPEMTQVQPAQMTANLVPAPPVDAARVELEHESLPPLDEECHAAIAKKGWTSTSALLKCRERQLLATLRENEGLREQVKDWKFSFEDLGRTNERLRAELDAIRKRQK